MRGKSDAVLIFSGKFTQGSNVEFWRCQATKDCLTPVTPYYNFLLSVWSRESAEVLPLNTDAFVEHAVLFLLRWAARPMRHAGRAI